MATYLEIKELLHEILCISFSGDENADITIGGSANGKTLTIPNELLRNAFDRMKEHNSNRLELCKLTPASSCFEVAVDLGRPLSRMTRPSRDPEALVDSVNNVSYSIGLPSIEYILFLLDTIAETVKTDDRRILRYVRMRGFLHYADDITELLSMLLRVHTLKITSTEYKSVDLLRKCATSYRFECMYTEGVPITEYSDVKDIYRVTLFRSHNRKVMDSPPQRIYNREVLDYYAMAMESRDPFTQYISFYHVIEHYFDAVFRRKLIDEIRSKITHVGFSYKNDDSLYELAKFVRKHMSSDDDRGKGNEFESLRYVLMEYVPIDELKTRIDALDPSAKDFYQSSLVVFTTSKKTKIAWSDAQGVYTNLATRIYETRNALVHSKSEQANNQYRPYENRKDLLQEMPLIRAVAELVITNTSEIM